MPKQHDFAEAWDTFLEDLEKGRKLFEQGHKDQLIRCLVLCMQKGVPIPPWLERAFKKAYFDVLSCEVKSWDDVFGRPLEKGKHAAKVRRDLKIAHPIWAAVQKRHAEGEPIAKKLFEEVGKLFDPQISGTIISDIYYETEEYFGPVSKEDASKLEVVIDAEYSRELKKLLKSFRKD